MPSRISGLCIYFLGGDVTGGVGVASRASARWGDHLYHDINCIRIKSWPCPGFDIQSKLVNKSKRLSLSSSAKDSQVKRPSILMFPCQSEWCWLRSASWFSGSLGPLTAQIINSSRRRGRFIFCSRSCPKDELTNGSPVPASLDEAMIQEAHEVGKVFLVGVLSEIPLNQTIYCTFDATWGVFGGGGDVHMQIHCLLVCIGDDLVIANSKSHVQEINRGGRSD